MGKGKALRGDMTRKWGNLVESKDTGLYKPSGVGRWGQMCPCGRIQLESKMQES